MKRLDLLMLKLAARALVTLFSSTAVIVFPSTSPISVKMTPNTASCLYQPFTSVSRSVRTSYCRKS